MNTSQEPLGLRVTSMSRPTLVGRIIGWMVDRPVAGPVIASVMRAPLRVTAISSRITRLHAWLLRRSRGRLRRSWMFAAGQPVLSLTTTGRRSGQSRTTAVACFTLDDDLAIAAMNLGRESNPGWVYNLMANPHAEIEIGGQRISVHARRTSGDEAEKFWRRWVDLQPSATRFGEVAKREIPIFVLTQQR